MGTGGSERERDRDEIYFEKLRGGEKIRRVISDLNKLRYVPVWNLVFQPTIRTETRARRARRWLLRAWG